MAVVNVAAGGVTTGVVTLVANDVLTVNFADRVSLATIFTDGMADIWYTTNGSTPTIGGSRRLPVGLAGYATVGVTGSGSTNATNSVKLVSAGSPVITVQVG